jgi:uncharacterized membrane protein YkoI
MKKITVLTAAVLLCLSSSALSADKKLSKSQLPAAVQKTVDEQSKGATVVGYSSEVENGKTEYEVKLTVDGHSKDVSIDASGNVLEIEEEVALDSLSPGVQAGLKKAAGTGTLGKVESLAKNGKVVAYEAKVTKGGKKSEVQVGPKGEKLAHEE